MPLDSDARSAYFATLQDLLNSTDKNPELFDTIVNAPFRDKKSSTTLSLGVVVLLLVNKKDNTIDRIALSDTESAKGAVRMSVKPFKQIRIPIDTPDNIIAQVIKSGHPKLTDDWQYLFIPELTPDEAHFNQAGAGIGCSAVYPLIGAEDGGAMIFSYYQPPNKMGPAHEKFMEFYSKAVAAKLATK